MERGVVSYIEREVYRSSDRGRREVERVQVIEEGRASEAVREMVLKPSKNRLDYTHCTSTTQANSLSRSNHIVQR